MLSRIIMNYTFEMVYQFLFKYTDFILMLI